MHADPVPVTASPQLTAATVVWRHAGKLYVTTVAKQSFSLDAVRGARPTAPAPIARAEVDAGRGRLLPDDIAPCVARGDVWVVGHLRAPAPVVDVALRVSRGAVTLFDKRVRVVADAQGQAFLGTLGPVSKRWPARARKLGSVPASLLDGAIIAVPDALDWAYFQASPVDQQVPWIAPRDEVTLEIAGLGALVLRIPSDLPRATVSEPGCGSNVVTLRPDGVAIDVDIGKAHVLYRGRVTLTGDPRRALVDVRLDDEAEMALAGTVEAPSTRGAVAEPSVAQTRSMPDDEVLALRAQFAMPFQDRESSAPYEPPPPPPGPSRDGSTVAVDASEVAALRAQFLPFGRSERASAPPSHAPQRLVAMPLEVAAPPPSAPPAPRPLPPPPASLVAESASAPRISGETVSADAEEVALLRAAYATPFDKPSAKLARERGAPPAIAKPQPPSSSAESVRSGETSLVDPEEANRLRQMYAAPFAKEKAAPAKLPPSADEPLGGSFLDALDDEPDPKR